MYKLVWIERKETEVQWIPLVSLKSFELGSVAIVMQISSKSFEMLTFW